MEQRTFRYPLAEHQDTVLLLTVLGWINRATDRRLSTAIAVLVPTPTLTLTTCSNEEPYQQRRKCKSDEWDDRS